MGSGCSGTGRDGGQTVSHLHFHLIGGNDMQWYQVKASIISHIDGNGISFIINKDIMLTVLFVFEAQVVGIGRRDTGGRIKVGKNESLDNALRRFKANRMSGVLSELRKREHYEKLV